MVEQQIQQINALGFNVQLFWDDNKWHVHLNSTTVPNNRLKFYGPDLSNTLEDGHRYIQLALQARELSA